MCLSSFPKKCKSGNVPKNGRKIFKNIPRPQRFLSVSGQTGGLFDNHDVLGVSAFEPKSEESKQFDREQHEQQLKVEFCFLHVLFL